MLDESEFEEPPDEFEMVLHNDVIGKGKKEEMKYELDAELEENMQLSVMVIKEKADKNKF